MHIHWNFHVNTIDPLYSHIIYSKTPVFWWDHCRNYSKILLAKPSKVETIPSMVLKLELISNFEKATIKGIKVFSYYMRDYKKVLWL